MYCKDRGVSRNQYRQHIDAHIVLINVIKRYTCHMLILANIAKDLCLIVLNLLGECPRTPYVGAGFSTVVPIRSPAPPRMVKTISKHAIVQHFSSTRYKKQCLKVVYTQGAFTNDVFFKVEYSAVLSTPTVLRVLSSALYST